MHDDDCCLATPTHNISVFSVFPTCTFLQYKSNQSIISIPAEYDIKYKNIEYEIEGPAM